jgi:cobalamin synthase
LPYLLLAVLLVVLEVLLTGALHFDGLADTADGFGGGRDRESILRIMRDHCIGSYGGTALALLVALKVTAYAALLDGDRWFPALLLTPVLGRWSILILSAALPYARETASIVREMGIGALLSGTVIVVAAVAASQLWVAASAAAAVLLVSAAFGFYCRRKIGGITGDTLGANLQLCESAILIVFLWRL